MNKLIEVSLKAANRLYNKVDSTNTFRISNVLAELKGQDVSDLIKKKLVGTAPAMICRIGAVEMHCLLTYRSIIQDKWLGSKVISYVKGETFPFWWDSAIFREMSKNAGFINPDKYTIEKFCRLMEDDMKQVDVLGSWMEAERLFFDKMSNAVKVEMRDLEPYRHENPWSEALENKTVLVIHPFEKSIQKQYLKRENLFKDSRVLPRFELKTIKAVQSIAYNETRYNSWFDALHSMQEQISKISFDIAIIGCGAYGFPLAAYVKRMGKKAVHLGGVTQVLFGIKGKRYEEDIFYTSSIFNDFWVKPLPEETPKLSALIEGNCYW